VEILKEIMHLNKLVTECILNRVKEIRIYGLGKGSSQDELYNKV
jgi:hypothetical protein